MCKTKHNTTIPSPNKASNGQAHIQTDQNLTEAPRYTEKCLPFTERGISILQISRLLEKPSSKVILKKVEGLGHEEHLKFCNTLPLRNVVCASASQIRAGPVTPGPGSPRSGTAG